MTYYFRTDYSAPVFASGSELNDAAFDAIVSAWWENHGPERIEVFSGPAETANILNADAADFGFECAHCGSTPGNIGAGAIVWSVPGVTIDDVEDNDLKPFCSAGCALVVAENHPVISADEIEDGVLYVAVEDGHGA